MIWYIAAAILFVVAGALMIYQYVSDRRYSKKKTSEAMGRDLWREIEEEHEASTERRAKFQAALRDARKRTGPDST